MRRLIPILSGAALLAIAGSVLASRSNAETAKAIPAPALDEAAGPATREVAVLAGGCYWGMQAIFEHVHGVKAVVAGFSGMRSGSEDSLIRSRDSTPAESIRLEYDPAQITYGLKELPEPDLVAVVVAVGRDSEAGDDPIRQTPEHRKILRLCQRPVTVADIASDTALPVGVVRVLLGDLILEEAVRVVRNRPAVQLPGNDVLKEILNGLRAL